MRGRAVHTARHTVPIAKNAGLATRHHTQNAIGWAKPRVNGARSWAAPRVERAGLAVRDRIAPKVSAALVTAAHRLDAKPRRTRRWPRRLAGSAMLAALASAIMAMATRHRPGAMTSDHGASDHGASDHGASGAKPAAATGSPGDDGDSGTGSAG
jgi:hypothetical protein